MEIEMSVLEELHYCIGLEFERNRETHTITMNQRSYIKEVLNLLNMNECKPVGTPFDVSLKLLELSDDEFGNVQRKMEGVPYKARVESLMYAMVGTRDDLAIAVSMVSQFISHAIASHSMAVKCIMRYLKDMLDFKICLERILRCGLGRRCKRPAIHHGVHVSCWRWSHFVEMQETQPLHCL